MNINGYELKTSERSDGWYGDLQVGEQTYHAICKGKEEAVIEWAKNTLQSIGALDVDREDK